MDRSHNLQLFNSEVSAGGGFNCIGFLILEFLQQSMFRPVQVYLVFRTHSAFHDVASYRPTRSTSRAFLATIFLAHRSGAPVHGD